MGIFKLHKIEQTKLDKLVGTPDRFKTVLYKNDKDGIRFEYSGSWENLARLEDIKASHNIIDLIEVGDYVNGEVMLEHYIKYHLIEHDFECNWYEEDIKEILTKEQYEANVYKVERS